MKVSLVMSVYNGARFILEQLDSIKDQTRKIDEVLIYDDASSDESFNIISDYIIYNKLNGWSIERNPNNFGWKKSFANGISNCTGDIIFTCDQDDIWVNDKVEVMISAMESKPECELLVADYISFLFNDLPNATARKNLFIKRIDVGCRWMYIQRPGCVFAFTKSLKDKFCVCWKENYAHDLLLWQIASLSDSIYHINFDAIYFRRHDTNATPNKPRSLKKRLELAEQSYDELIHLKNIIPYLSVNEKALNMIEDMIKFELNRIRFFNEQKKVVFNAFVLLSQIRYYYKWPAWGIDIMCKLKGEHINE